MRLPEPVHTHNFTSCGQLAGTRRQRRAKKGFTVVTFAGLQFLVAKHEGNEPLADFLFSCAA